MPPLSEALPSKRELRPDLQVDSVAEIDARALYDRGIRAIAFDADQTLCRFHGMGINERLLTNIEVMRSLFEDRLCIISNCTDRRREELIEHFPAVRRARQQEESRPRSRTARRSGTSTCPRSSGRSWATASSPTSLARTGRDGTRFWYSHSPRRPTRGSSPWRARTNGCCGGHIACDVGGLVVQHPSVEG